MIIFTYIAIKIACTSLEFVDQYFLLVDVNLSIEVIRLT
jgi:hypothetical protein